MKFYHENNLFKFRTLYYALVHNIWLYGVLRRLNATQTVFFFIASLCSIILFYKLGQYLNWVLWTCRLKGKLDLPKESIQNEGNEIKMNLLPTAL